RPQALPMDRQHTDAALPHSDAVIGPGRPAIVTHQILSHVKVGHESGTSSCKTFHGLASTLGSFGRVICLIKLTHLAGSLCLPMQSDPAGTRAPGIVQAAVLGVVAERQRAGKTGR